MQNVSEMAGSLVGSEVLRIAAEINQLNAGGKKIINFTVGDFNPAYFPIPETLRTGIVSALNNHQTNYPPSSGIPPLREAVAEFYTREFNVPTRANEVLIAGGARPLIYTIFTTLLDPGETVVYPVPSWNNNHYVHLARCQSIAVKCSPERGFLPTAAELRPHLGKARLLCLNSPLNPSGGAFREEELRQICQDILAENHRRKEKGERPLYLMYDQIYWKLTLSGARHINPVAVEPAMREFTLFVDGVSKYFCGTGLRVGWSILPEALVPTFSNVLGHIGAWAPKPEQIATAEYLRNLPEVDSFAKVTREHVERRLFPLFDGIEKLKARGLPVDVIRPEGGIYLSLRITPRNANTTNEEIRRELLERAGIAVVPFQAFGLKDESGWFRLSVGAVSEADIPVALSQLENFFK